MPATRGALRRDLARAASASWCGRAHASTSSASCAARAARTRYRRPELADAGLRKLDKKTPLVDGTASRPTIRNGLTCRRRPDGRPAAAGWSATGRQVSCRRARCRQAPAHDRRDFWEPIHAEQGRAADPRSRRVLHPGLQGGACRCRPSTPPRWCRSTRWWANSACTTRASSIRASATRRRAAGRQGRAGGAQPGDPVRAGGRPDDRRAWSTSELAERPTKILYGSELELQLPGPGPEALQAFQVGAGSEPASHGAAAATQRRCGLTRADQPLLPYSRPGLAAIRPAWHAVASACDRRPARGRSVHASARDRILVERDERAA